MRVDCFIFRNRVVYDSIIDRVKNICSNAFDAQYMHSKIIVNLCTNSIPKHEYT